MKTDRRTFIFQIALSIYLTTVIYDESMFGCMTLFSNISKCLRYMAYLLLIWKVIEDNYYEPNQLLKYGIGILISLVSYVFTNEKVLLFIVLFLMAVTNVYFRDVIKVSLWTVGVCLLSIILFYKFGLIPERFAMGTRSRHSLGFVFPTIGSNHWLYFILMYIAYRKEKLKFIEGIILEGISCYFFVMTDTRNAFAISTIALLLSYVLKLWTRRKKRWLFSFLIKYITFIGTAFFGLLIFLWDKVRFISETVNSLLTNRIALSYWAVQEYGIRLFGQPIQWVSGTNEYETVAKTYNYVDSSYVQILITYGVFILLIVCLGYTLLGLEIVKMQEWYLGGVIVLGAIHSTFDPQFLQMQYNIFFLATGYLLISDKVNRRKYLFGLLKEEQK